MEVAGKKIDQIQGARKEWERPDELAEGEDDPNKDPQRVGSVGTEDSKVTPKDSSDPEAPWLEHELPREMRNGIGMGPNGLIEKGVKATEGSTKGGLLGPSSSGQSTSGGGPPVGNYGPGKVGEEGTTVDLPGNPGNSNISSEEVGEMTKEDAEALEKELQDEVLDNLAIAGVIRANTIDGDQPMPYTGSGSWGEKPEPATVGGPGGDSGNFTPIVSVDGKVVWGGGDTNVYVGYGSSGNSTFSPDGSSEPDDSGKFHGGLFGSGDRPNNPDDPDYYTPNELNTALKAK